MPKVADDDRCSLYHKRGSRHTRCTGVSEMSYRVVDVEGVVNEKKKGEPYDLRICHECFKLEIVDLDTACLNTLKINPPKNEDEEHHDGP